MTRAQEKRLKAALEAKRQELIREIAEGRERLAIAPSSDPADQVRGIEDRDLAIRSVDQMHSVLRLVERALREISRRSYGVCAECGDDIAIKRLKALPWSPFCVSCQERVERTKVKEIDYAPPYALAG
jgi:DnaK suppressor protein